MTTPVGPSTHASTTTTPDTPKHVRECLCLAEAALAQFIRDGYSADMARLAITQIGTLIDRIDEHRPVGTGGKHGEHHTPTCGCDGHQNPWSIIFYPRDLATEGHP